MFQPEISSFRLHLAAEGKAAKTIRTYTEVVQWFAAAHLTGQAGRDSWDQVRGRDIERWIAGLLGRYSSAYASNQFRGGAAVLQVAGGRGKPAGSDRRASCHDRG